MPQCGSFVAFLSYLVVCTMQVVSAATVGQLETLPAALSPGYPSGALPWDCPDESSQSQAAIRATAKIGISSLFPDPQSAVFAPDGGPYNGPGLDGSCNSYNAGTFLYADDPETWSESSWTKDSVYHHAVELAKVILPVGSQGLIYYYYYNNLHVTAHFYINASTAYSSGASTTIGYLERHTLSGFGTTAGAQETASFLTGMFGSNFIPVLLPPKRSFFNNPIVEVDVPKNNIIQGEIEIGGMNTPVMVGLSADRCDPHCIMGTVNDQVSVPTFDPKDRLGSFNYGSYLVYHLNEPSSTPQAGQLAYIDLVSFNNGGVPPLTGGVDMITGGQHREDQGDYGFPLEIVGFNPNDSLTQRLSIGPRGGTIKDNDDNYAVYLNGFKTAGGAAIAAGGYILPSSGVMTGPLDSNPGQAALLGASAPQADYIMYFIPSGGDKLPARLFYGLH
jgi:hypothetical protein